MPTLRYNGNKIGGTVEDSLHVNFNNTNTNLEATNVQEAIEDVSNDIVKVSNDIVKVSSNLNNTINDVSNCALRWVETKRGADNTINLSVSNELDLYILTSDSQGKETYAILLASRITNIAGKVIPLYDKWNEYGGGTYTLIGLGLNVSSAYGFFVKHYTFIK